MTADQARTCRKRRRPRVAGPNFKTAALAVRPALRDHVYIAVTNVEKSLAFYAEALKPLGWRRFGNYDAASGPEDVPDLYGLGDDTYVSRSGVGSSMWLRQRRPGETGLYVGIVCDTTELVDAACAAAIEAGGRDEGKPADCSYVAPGYYAANVADFDGNRVEFVRKAWNPTRRAARAPSLRAPRQSLKGD